jgi:rod shape-determining protein MreD
MTNLPKLWLYRGIFLLLGLFMVALPLLPLQFNPAQWPMPDMLFALTLAWVVRQPQSAPFLLVAALALLADAVLMRPLGLWAFLFLITVETIRPIHKTIQERGVLFEGMVALAALVVMLIMQNILLWISFSKTMELALSAKFVLRTLLFYSFMIMFLHYIIRVRKPDISNRPDRLGKIK